MEEIPFTQEINGRLIYLLNRDTGEILFFNHYFCLDFHSNIVFKIENNIKVPVVFGCFDNRLWHWVL